jgi:hypothetical protein
MILDQIGLQQHGPTLAIVFEDNWAYIHLSLHHKSKHINVSFYHLRDMCKAGIMMLMKVGADHQPADALIQALPRAAFVRHWSVMLNHNCG